MESIWAETTTGCILGSSGLGKRQIQPTDVGRKAAQDLVAAIQGPSSVDPFAQDQASSEDYIEI